MSLFALLRSKSLYYCAKTSETIKFSLQESLTTVAIHGGHHDEYIKSRRLNNRLYLSNYTFLNNNCFPYVFSDITFTKIV